MPVYIMGFYLLPLGIHDKMNSIRSKFFWQGSNEELKYHMAKWEMLALAEPHGGDTGL
jgi:hypothetical protein